MLLGARQFFERRGAPTPPLPYDAEVEYLETDGSSYLDIGFKGSDQTSIDAVFYRQYNTNSLAFGSCQTWGRDILEFATNATWVYWMFGGSVSSTYLAGSSQLTGQIRITTSGAHISAKNLSNGSVYTKTSTGTTPFSTPYNLVLLAANEGGSVGVDSAGTRIYSAEVRDGDNHVDLIPVRITNEQGVSEGAMYDRVSGALFRNAGTGAFLYGPDKS